MFATTVHVFTFLSYLVYEIHFKKVSVRMRYDARAHTYTHTCDQPIDQEILVSLNILGVHSVFILHIRISSVSYTHLDVYKRQLYDIVVFIQC